MQDYMGFMDWYHQLGAISISRHYAWHGHLWISVMPKHLHFAKQLFLNLLDLMSLFSIFVMFPETFLSKSPLGNQNMGTPFCMLHIQLSKLRKELIVLPLFYLCYKQQTNDYKQHTWCLSEQIPQFAEFLFLIVVLLPHEHFGSSFCVENLPPWHCQTMTFLNHKQLKSQTLSQPYHTNLCFCTSPKFIAT